MFHHNKHLFIFVASRDSAAFSESKDNLSSLLTTEGKLLMPRRF